MDGQEARQWGITRAISNAQPTEADLKLNDALVEALKRENNFETAEGTEKRKKVLAHLQKVTEEFVRRVCKMKKLPPSTVESAGGKVFTFGSYALGVNGPSSDIDTLVVAPKHVFRDDFFDHFPPTFREMSAVADITELNPVREAFVPIIKMEYRGVSIDLLFASLPSLSRVGSDLELTDLQLLRGLDDIAMRSVNGTRVTKELLDNVPQPKAFRHALRAVKLWSNQRAIYGAVFGFPGGIAWAIMVARICQLYPFACGATILAKFFGLMLKWQWPRPIMLKDVEPGSLNLKVWNPQLYGADRAHIMPVLTPAYPSMCSTHTVMPSTMRIMMAELDRAAGILDQIQAGTKSWKDLFQRHTFFTHDHKYYLSVVATAYSKEAHEIWSGLVQSKVRLLVKGIDDGAAGVELARPYVKAFERVHRCANEEQIDEVKQGNVKYQIKEDEVPAAGAKASNGDAPKIIYTTTFYIGLTLPEAGTKSLDISYPVSEFKRYIAMSESYREEDMFVRIVHTRNHQLPDDVFLAGETKPTKSVKEKKKKASGSRSAKRQFAETGLEDSEKVSKKRQSEVNGLPTPTPA